MKILRLIKNYIGEVMLVVGVGLFTYNVFDFSFSDSTRGLLTPSGLPSLGGRDLGNVAYYYTETNLLLISAGAMLTVVGILVIRNRNKVL